MKKKTSLISTYGTVVILVVLALVLLIIKFGIQKNGIGEIELTVPQVDSTIFFENRERATTQTENEIFNAENLRKKEYSLLVSKQGFWPWIKNIEIKDPGKISLVSWSLPQVPDIEKIETFDSNFNSIWNKITNQKQPDEDNKLSREEISVWLEGNKILAEWTGGEDNLPYYFCEEVCQSRITVLQTTSNIDGLAFLKDRNDVLIFANDEGIFARKINKIGIQNFQPIMRVNSPRFFTDDGYIIYVLENRELSSMAI